jgi:probable addiction module antidote protein
MKFRKDTGIIEYSPTKELLDEERIAKAIWECLKNNEPEGIIELIEAHLRAKNKTELAKKHSLPRTTLHHAFKGKNPTVKTLAKLVNCCA